MRPNSVQQIADLSIGFPAVGRHLNVTQRSELALPLCLFIDASSTTCNRVSLRVLQLCAVALLLQGLQLKQAIACCRRLPLDRPAGKPAHLRIIAVSSDDLTPLWPLARRLLGLAGSLIPNSGVRSDERSGICGRIINRDG